MAKTDLRSEPNIMVVDTNAVGTGQVMVVRGLGGVIAYMGRVWAMTASDNWYRFWLSNNQRLDIDTNVQPQSEVLA